MVNYLCIASLWNERTKHHNPACVITFLMELIVIFRLICVEQSWSCTAGFVPFGGVTSWGRKGCWRDGSNKEGKNNKRQEIIRRKTTQLKKITMHFDYT